MIQHFLTPYADAIPPYVWWEDAFNDQELSWLQLKAKNAQQTGTVGAGTQNKELKQVRRSSVWWMNKNDETEWVFQRLSHIVSSLNSRFYRFDLTGFAEDIQMTNYESSENGMYDWHQDYGMVGVSRKLSVVMQLSDPSEYEGGTLQIMVDSTPKQVQKKRGLIVAFPSYVLHQVTPVTKGSRQSLVTWIAGPQFK